ncbi:translocation/assembly module TamB domain-containing protein [Lysobacter sp. KIS68-7]|uniref:translocation/assembly module TamB domain-containing protein n=1 Tax=Lysobacter sp. KIS68-7 TaxID=2904252 RepID=UPI001E5A36D4|nr:translocation/assembly module TamB domain-containing protein [Lysobacter sp. KIS68-7]UHQ20411.1 translocation/assembly module TamB domain-containing protein [Lysobacter sp. KIS68-7]
MPLTPEQRAERSAARRALARKVALRSALGAVALFVAAMVLLWWLVTTVGGRDVLLAQIVSRLPPGASLTWRAAEGPVTGPLTMHGVRFTYASDPKRPTRRIEFTARTIVVDPALRPLLGRTLRLDALDVRGATLEIPESEEPFEFPRWPESLPTIAPPLALQADTIHIDGLRVTKSGEALVDVRSARGGLRASKGFLHVEHLNADTDLGRFTAHGDYVPRDRYRTDFIATAVLPATAGRTAPRVGVVARGDVAQLDVAIAGRLPAPLRATLVLRGEPDPTWHVRADAPAFDPAVLTGEPPSETPLAFKLRADGLGGRATVEGFVAQGDLRADIRPSQVRLDDRVLTVEPLVVDALGGRTTLHGFADLRDPNDRKLRFAINARGLRWGGTPDTPAIVGDGDIGIAGKPEAWAAVGRATLVREEGKAQVQFDARGDAERATLRSLTARMPSGTLDAKGDVQWSPVMTWKLDTTLAGFDPGYFAPDWPGRVEGRIATQGKARPKGGVDATFDAPALRGTLRGRPLDARANVQLHGDEIAGDVALNLGASHATARGRIGAVLDIAARFEPLRLDDLLPGAGGVLRGTATLRGPRDTPDIAADLTGDGLHWGDWRADSLRANGRLPWRNGNGTLHVEAHGVQAGLAMDRVVADARGAMERLSLDASLESSLGGASLSGTANRRGAEWSGALSTLRLMPSKGAPWTLDHATTWRWDGRNGALSNACLSAEGGGALCANADWPRRGLDVHADHLPLTLVTPWLPPREDDRPWLLHGDVAFTAQVRPVGNAWRGNAKLSSASGGMRNSERSRNDLISYDNFSADLEFDPQRLSLVLGTTFNEDGRLDARVATGWDDYAPLSGEVQLRTDSLTWMELFSPDIAEPTGLLEGRVALGGTRAQPTLGGNAHLSNFAVEVPPLAIAPHDGDIRLEAQPDGSARIAGTIVSGDGTLHVSGTLGWQGNDTPLVLNVTGTHVLAADTRDLNAVIAPDVVVRYQAGQPMEATGTVTVESGRMDLERLDSGVSRSPDVVVLDPVDPKRGVQTTLSLDLTLVLPENAVKLNGFGLEGALDGRLRVRQRPGSEMVATGRLDVSGKYTAYGQELEISRGELTWSNSAIADPLLDIRAQREIGDVTAGIQVRGRATAPQAEVWSDPEMDKSEALSYLALGRPLSTASSDESRQLDAASAALAAGGGLVASQIASHIGLDEAGMMDSRTLGGSVFGVGKYLSPKLYVGYGVSLLGTGQVLTLKYLLRKGFDIQVESSTVENRGSVNWRKEK